MCIQFGCYNRTRLILVILVLYMEIKVYSGLNHPIIPPAFPGAKKPDRRWVVLG